MNKTKISILAFTFLSGIFLPEPNFIYENFWIKAKFWDSIPFNVYYWQYRMLYAVILVFMLNYVMAFIKKYT
jgi:hypothetical protein